MVAGQLTAQLQAPLAATLLCCRRRCCYPLLHSVAGGQPQRASPCTDQEQTKRRTAAAGGHLRGTWAGCRAAACPAPACAPVARERQRAGKHILVRGSSNLSHCIGRQLQRRASAPRTSNMLQFPCQAAVLLPMLLPRQLLPPPLPLRSTLSTSVGFPTRTPSVPAVSCKRSRQGPPNRSSAHLSGMLPGHRKALCLSAWQNAA